MSACWVMVGLPKPYEQVTELEFQNSFGGGHRQGTPRPFRPRPVGG